MTETQTLAQLKRKYDAEMVSALLGAGFTKNAYGKALNWTELLMDLVEERLTTGRCKRCISSMYTSALVLR